MKLGELLVRKGLIDRDQLRKALDSQLIVGGHLGTCLIEKGFIDEDCLGEVLAETSALPYATRAMLVDVPRCVVNSLPAKLVVKHNVVPFRLDKKLLDVAMIDPKNLQAIDELSFAAGYRIRPWIAPEMRIFQAMERYYDVPRRQRYVALCRQVDQSGDAESAIVHMDRVGEARPREDGVERPHPRGEADFGITDDAELTDLLCSSENPDRLGEAVLAQAGKGGVTRALLFKVINASATFWRAYGVWMDRVTAASLSFPIVSEPVFGLLRGEAQYRGPVPDEVGYRQFYTKLGMAVPPEILVLPVYTDDRLVALFYADGGAGESGGPIRGDTEDYRRLMKRFGLALNLVVLRRQIRSA
jgi:hypothetical protein